MPKLTSPPNSGALAWMPMRELTIGVEPVFYRNATVSGGPEPVRAYIGDLLPEIMEGRIEPGRVFDRTVGLDGVPDGYRAMNDREALKVLVRP
jgi:threonine dehydrogenase-like Zn-dependent dehydrogenase